MSSVSAPVKFNCSRCGCEFQKDRYLVREFSRSEYRDIGDVAQPFYETVGYLSAPCPQCFADVVTSEEVYSREAAEWYAEQESQRYRTVDAEELDIIRSWFKTNQELSDESPDECKYPITEADKSLYDHLITQPAPLLLTMEQVVQINHWRVMAFHDRYRYEMSNEMSNKERSLDNRICYIIRHNKHKLKRTT